MSRPKRVYIPRQDTDKDGEPIVVYDPSLLYGIFEVDDIESGMPLRKVVGAIRMNSGVCKTIDWNYIRFDTIKDKNETDRDNDNTDSEAEDGKE